MAGALRSAFATPRFGAPGSMVVPLREHLVGGRTVEWELRDPARVGNAAQPWGDGVSFLQADHLATMADKRSRGEDHTGFLLAAMRFDSPLDEIAMARALTDFVRRHEELRAHYRSGSSGLERWVSPPEEFVIDVADAESVVVDDADVGSWVGRRASESARAELVPGSWWAATVDDAGFTFFVATDHAHGDGYSSVLALAEITALYRVHGDTAERDGDGPHLPSPGAFGDAVQAERSAAVALSSDDDRVAAWRDVLVDNDGRAPRCPLDLGLTDAAPVPAVAVEQWLLDRDALARCDVRLADSGGGFAGLLYAALAVRHREITGESRFFVSTVLATRDTDHAWTQGWMCNFAPVVVDLPAGDQTTFDDVVRAAGAGVRAARRASTAPAHGVLALLAAEGVFRGLDGSPYMVSYTDLARLPIGNDPALATMQTSSGVGPTRNANLWFTRTPAGLVVRCHLPDNDVARVSVVDHLARVGVILNDYASERIER